MTETLQVTLTHVLTLCGLLVTILGGLMSLLMKAHEKRFDERFRDFDQRIVANQAASHANERALLILKAELPREYVPREDYMRNQLVLENKIDVVREKLENLSLRSLGGHG